MDFKTWLLEQIKLDPITNRKKRDDVVSDLAYDVRGDKNFPGGGHYKRYYRHLINNGACIEAIKAFRQAWLEWIDEGLEKWELSWDIRTPRKPTGHFEALSLVDIVCDTENEAPNEPKYTEEMLEMSFRRGYFHGMSDTHDFLTAGGLSRQLMRWYDKLFEWYYHQNTDKRIEPPPPPSPWRETRKLVLERDSDICVYCGIAAAKEVDHIFPIKLGGCDDLLNLVICCKSCNSRKHAKHPLQWRLSAIFLKNNQDILRYLDNKYPGMECDYFDY